ncbi:DNA-binding transcriptional regulator DsdC [Budviciaceae bacterium BWR-B9]|uniref:DNA-binding transcriptional regulator DsdC n=1 Tax=Limnobaculum allomyrinae TaxID=2791986 RepID=A0ABS1IMY9_9GAMM|nr:MULTISPECIES: DNA-binding transcriptional regulator DsdC [Limnobaculum]MBK5143118.1 DNA-binding transcriptional regulator DsdC [Limnobaculum allomyrinae]MBV7691007.1 DNA-binding transcriptional regulator DsdC [Limnobaculum sp. M2-1]
MYTEDSYLARNRLLNSYQLSKLHTFEAAARHSSFAMAADELSLSPSAVSHRINGLEEELGIKLFQRFHRKIELTPEGQRVYWALKSSLEYLNQEILEIKNQELSGNLTVYSRPSIAQCWLVPKLADFGRQYPSISLNILTGNENVNFRGYGIDLAIYFDDITPEKLACQHLMDESMVPVCSPEYARQHQLQGNIHNLKHCTLLHDRQAWSYDSDTDEWSSWARHFNLTLEADRHSMGFDRSDLAIIAAINHAGVAMGRKKLVNKRLANNELVTPFPEMEVMCEQRYYIATLPERRDPKIDAFIGWLKAVV